MSNRTRANRPRPNPAGARPAGRRPCGTAAAEGGTLYTPGASPLRQSLERASAAPLAYLHQLPALVPALVLAVLLIVGLAVKGAIGAAALACVAAALSWLAFVSWPGLTGRGRLGRSAAIACVLAVAVLQATR